MVWIPAFAGMTLTFMDFQLKSSFKPTGDQPKAIKSLLKGFSAGLSEQVLLGVTGSGKTFTMANVIAHLNKPTLIVSHNKTLAAQLYQEFRDFFPKNAVSYFVSYYDYYQPEAYVPQSDTYIEKETEINEEIDKLRLAATTNLLTRRDTIIVASVSCIYNLGSPKEYGNFVLEMAVGMKVARESIFSRLLDLQYEKTNFEFTRGSFRVRGDIIDVFLAYEDSALRIAYENNTITGISRFDPITGKTTEELKVMVIYPAKHFMADPNKNKDVFNQIKEDLDKRVKELKMQGKLLEAHRLSQKVNYDLEMIQEIGYVNGIENYSRYFDGRKPGDSPYTLLDYFRHPYGKDWILMIDESHMSIPQIRGMYNGDRSRKQTLIDFGFRLPSALDNRPLTFTEFLVRQPQTLYVSATPSEYEIEKARSSVVIPTKVGIYPGSRGKPGMTVNPIAEQLIRPTGIVDPEIMIRPIEGQVIDLAREAILRKKKGERVLVTCLTKRMAEDLAEFLHEKKYMDLPEFKDVKKDEYPSVTYLHSDVLTLERSDILDELRGGKYDVLVGINLLREGLDLPEVSLVAILDADKEGFLRSQTSLVQTMGRAARHISGTVILYADIVTGSMERAIKEITRRRTIQLHYNRTHHITPVQVSKPIREKLIEHKPDENRPLVLALDTKKKVHYEKLLAIPTDSLTPKDTGRLIKKLEASMKDAATELNFELAATLRDKIRDIKFESNLVK